MNSTILPWLCVHIYATVDAETLKFKLTASTERVNLFIALLMRTHMHGGATRVCVTRRSAQLLCEFSSEMQRSNAGCYGTAFVVEMSRLSAFCIAEPRQGGRAASGRETFS